MNHGSIGWNVVHRVLLGVLLAGAAQQAAAVDVLTENFNDTSQFSVSSGFFSDGGFDYLGLVEGPGGDFGGDPVPVGAKPYSGFTGAYLAGMDLDGEGAALPIQIEWTGLDVTGLGNLRFSGDFAEFFDAPGDIDFDDFVRVEARLDGGVYETVLEFRLDVAEPDNFNGIFREDTDLDGRGDGEALGSAATTFLAAIAGVGNTLDLRLTLRLNAGDEDIGVDNFRVTGTEIGGAFVETFDDGSGFTVSSGFFSDGGFDYLGLTGGGSDDFGGDPAPAGAKPYTGFVGSYLTGMDLDGEGAALPVTLEWSGIDISGLPSVQFSGDFAEFFDAPGDIDFDDFIRVEARIDGGAYETVLEFRLDEGEPDNFNGVFSEDTDLDGRGDGTALGNAATTFSKPVAGTGNVLDLRLTVRVNAGDEDFGVDNFVVEEGPAAGFVEPFDNDAQFTISSPFFSDGGFDYLGLTGGGTEDFGGDPAPAGAKPYSGFAGSYLTGMDLDGEGANLPIVIDWAGIDISGLDTLQFSGDFAEFFDAPGDIDFDDFIRVEARVDGGAFQNVLEFRLDVAEPDNFNGVFSEDTNLDGRGDGQALGNAAERFTSPIAGIGDSLDLRLTVRLNAGDEDFAVDNFAITGQGGDPDPDPDPEPEVPLVFIHEIQGSGPTSPLAGQELAVEAIVTGVYPGLSGFFVQEEDADADADPQTSEGIFVFEPGASVAVGDEVRIVGTAGEFSGLTQLSGVVELIVQNAGLALPTAASVSLPLASVDDLEAFEGMLVTFPQALVVTETFNLARFGEIDLAIERLYNPTHVAEPGVDALAVNDLNDRSRIRIDDGATTQNPDPTFYPAGGLSASNTVRVGDSLTGLTGVLNFNFGSYKVVPPEPVEFDPTNPRPLLPDNPGGSLKVATANLLNYFVTIDDGSNSCGPGESLGCRGADSAVELERQQAKIVAALSSLNADIVGLVEIENSPAPVLATLVGALNAVDGDGVWDFVDTGAIGGDAIKVGFIYKPATVTPTGPFAVLDNESVIPTKNRVPLAQTFAENASGELVTLAVNHFKSKGSACSTASAPGELVDPDTGDGQGNCNLTRLAAAQALAAWLATDPTGQGDPDYLILGDLNAYAMEDPIDALKAAGYTDLTNEFLGAEAYSFVFGGESGYLDYALSSTTLTPQVTGLAEWHINADEVRALDYNTEFKSPDQVGAFFDPGPYRASDHDPLVLGLALASAPELDPIGDLAARVKSTSVNLTWSPVDGAVGYNIYRQAGAGEPQLLAGDYFSDVAVYADRIATGVLYTYFVEWIDADGNVSPPSNEVTAMGTSRPRRGR